MNKEALYRNKTVKFQKFKIYWILLLCLPFTDSFAQEYLVKKKEAVKQLKIATNDTTRINILLQIADLYEEVNPDSAFIYYQQAMDLAEKVQSEKYIAKSLIRLGNFKVVKGFFDEAIQLYQKAQKIFTVENDLKSIAFSNNKLGFAYWKKGDFKEGLARHLEALKISEELDDKPRIAQIYNDIGLIHWDRGSLEKALSFYKKSQAINEALNDLTGLSRTYNNIGLIYRELGDKSKALDYYLKSLEFSTKVNCKVMMTVTECNIGRIYTELGNYQLSEEHYYKGLEMAYQTNNLEAQAVISIYMSISFIIQKKYHRSVKYGLKGLELTKKINALPFQKLAYENLAIANDSLENYRDAYYYHKLYKELNDSIFNEASMKQILEMQTKYDTEKKDRENELLKKDNELQQLIIKKETNYRNFLMVITVLVLLLSFLLYRSMRDKRKNEIALENKVKIRTIEFQRAKEKAEENDRLKSAFLANISHEIRTPMNGIMGFAGLLKRPNLNGEKQKEFIKKIEKSGERMLNIINNLIEISKVESGQMELSSDVVNINQEIRNLHQFMRINALEKGLEFNSFCSLEDDKSMLVTDREKFWAVLNNLLKNALKFTLSGSVEFGYEQEGDFLKFFVKDTGIGIADEMKKIVFERFIQADLSAEKSYEGAGLGLSLSKAYIEMMGGRIWVESEYWMGSTFYFTIPLVKTTINITKQPSEKAQAPNNILR